MACGTALAGAFEAIRRSSAVLRLLDRFVCCRHLCWQLLKKGGPTLKKFDRAELTTDDAHAVCLNKLWSHCACSVNMCGGVRHQAPPPPTKPCPPLLTTLNLQLTSMIPGTIPGCPMPGKPVDPGILSIPGFLGPSRDVPCEWSQWILEYLVSQDSWDNPGMSHVRGVQILSIPGFLGPSRDVPCE